MKTLTHKEWHTEGVGRFGKDPTKWQFRCPRCGNIQSIESVLEHHPSLKSDDVLAWIYFSCEGRKTDGYGCDWTLGGLLHIHECQVVDTEGKTHMVFEFAEPVMVAPD